MARSAGRWLVPFDHQRLHRDRRLDRADDARKLQQETVAGVLHEPAAVIEDDRMDRAAMRLEGGVRAFLVERPSCASSRRRQRRLWPPGVFPSPMLPNRRYYYVVGRPNPTDFKHAVSGGNQDLGAGTGSEVSISGRKPDERLPVDVQLAAAICRSRCTRDRVPRKIIAIRNQRRNASGCIRERTACPMNMPAKAAAIATAPGSAVARVQQTGAGEIEGQRHVRHREEHPERLHQFVLLHADRLHERHRRDDLDAGRGGDQRRS